jgi:hypothetical protein
MKIDDKQKKNKNENTHIVYFLQLQKIHSLIGIGRSYV